MNGVVMTASSASPRTTGSPSDPISIIESAGGVADVVRLEARALRRFRRQHRQLARGRLRLLRLHPLGDAAQCCSRAGPLQLLEDARERQRPVGVAPYRG